MLATFVSPNLPPPPNPVKPFPLPNTPLAADGASFFPGCVPPTPPCPSPDAREAPPASAPPGAPPPADAVGAAGVAAATGDCRTTVEDAGIEAAGRRRSPQPIMSPNGAAGEGEAEAGAGDDDGGETVPAPGRRVPAHPPASTPNG